MADQVDQADQDPPFAAGQIVTVFRSRLRDDAGDDYGTTAAEMERLGRAMPGFVDFKSFVADDGERLALTTFADAESQRAWRTRVDHRAAQQAGRDRFYARYSLQVCECRSARSFVQAEAAG
ncbi:MAG TPA: antibiotic biosynthesis monooxygenase [Acidimicrobiales bacterium]|nr:antibiotic biosynthesis monooxygenase [Acidimicrobiales bacterium]